MAPLVTVTYGSGLVGLCAALACAGGPSAVRPSAAGALVDERGVAGANGARGGDGSSAKGEVAPPSAEVEAFEPADCWGEEGPSPERVRVDNARHGLVCEERLSGFGCSDPSGKEIVPYVYQVPLHFREAGFALTVARGEGWIYIDARHEQRLSALTLDAEPDEAYCVPARVRAGEKIGFLDPRRGVTIPPAFGSAFLFRDGKALVCVGCHPKRWAKHAPREARCTGEAFFIDETGSRLPDVPELWDCPAPSSVGGDEED